MTDNAAGPPRETDSRVFHSPRGRRCDDTIAMIGNTPLVRLRGASERAGAELWGKCEFLNPTGSVKDRAARGIVEQAERRGELEPGGTIVEGTAGNTGIGLALVAAVKGYRCVLVIADSMSPEKIGAARLLGAEVEVVPKAPYTDEGNYNHVARRRAEAIPGAIWANQFDNEDNVLAHYQTTGPEIWEQTEGRIDAVIWGCGTGGTLSGVGRFLKERRRDVRVVVSDPGGSALASYVTSGEVKAEGSSIIEGVGIGRVTKCFDREVVDEAFRVGDQEAIDETYRLLREEGLHVGASSGLSVAGAIRWARENPSAKRIVVNLCDVGSRYASRIFDPDWLAAQGLRIPDAP